MVELNGIGFDYIELNVRRRNGWGFLRGISY